MLFVRYENWKSYLKYYPITTILFVANIVMYLILVFNGGASDHITIIRFGALTNVEGMNEWWRYVTSLFLHGGFSHLLFNDFAILVFCPPLERLLGAWRYALLYLLSGVIGNILSVAHYNRLGETLLTLGASGRLRGVRSLPLHRPAAAEPDGRILAQDDLCPACHRDYFLVCFGGTN